MNRKIINNRVEKAVLGMFTSTSQYIRALNEAATVETSIGPCLEVWTAPHCSQTGAACKILVKLEDVINLTDLPKEKTTTP